MKATADIVCPQVPGPATVTRANVAHQTVPLATSELSESRANR